MLLYHVFCDGLPVSSESASLLRLFVPFNGGIAVMTFFLVSGFALSTKFLSDGDYRSLVQIGAGRYFRLVIPIFVACFAVHLALVFKLIDPPGERLPAFQEILRFDPTLSHLFRFALFDVLFDFDFAETYFGPLWTMPVEFQGSLLVLVLVALPMPLRWRPALLAIAAGCFLAFDSMFALFLSGAAMADAFQRGWIDRIPSALAVTMIIAAVMMPFIFGSTSNLWSLKVIAIVLTVGCLAYAPARAWLSGPVSRYLGKISFPLYLMHAPVMLVIGMPLMLSYGHSTAAKLAIDFLTVAVSFLAAHAIVPSNEYSIRLSRWVGDRVVGALFRVPNRRSLLLRRIGRLLRDWVRFGQALWTRS